jgi:CBS-domain-containing membrane protein
MAQKLKVADVMTRDVTTVYEESNLQEVLSLLGPYRFRHLPVVDGKRVVGILSHRDLLKVTSQGMDKTLAAQARETRLLEQTFVRDVMNTNVLTTRAEGSLAEAARSMLDGKVGALVVVNEQEELLGIVTETDLLRCLVHML